MATHFLLLTTLLLAVNSAFGIVCYDCDSSTGAQCNFGLLSFTYPTQDCDHVNSGSGFLDAVTKILPKNCVKIVGIDKDGKEYVARRCAPSTGPINTCDIIAKGVKFASGNELQKLDCWQCDTDKCNSADKITAMSFVGLLCATITFLFQL